jgi:hypothetical protein
VATVYPEAIELTDFSGGLNLRDAQGQLSPTETPSCLNVTFDERGGVQKRLGYAKDGSMSAFAADITNFYYSESLDQLIVQEGTNLKRRTAAGTFSAAFDTVSTAARVAFCDFAGKLVYVHPVDGLFTFDGTTVTGPHGGAPVKGSAIAVWGNKVWVAAYPSSDANGNPTRIVRSALGDPTTWTASHFSDAREWDDEAVVALSVAPRGGLMWFKRNSCGKVTSAETGFLQLIDAGRGAAGHLATVPFEGNLAVVNEHGIYMTDGISEMVEASGKIEPLFHNDQLNLGALDSFCAGRWENRVVFSLRRAGQTVNDLTLEWSPSVGWFAPHNFGAAAFATLEASDNQLFHAAPGSARLIYTTFDGGSDDGAMIASHFQTGWFAPGDGLLSRCRRVHVRGRGMVDMYVRHDFEVGGGVHYPLDLNHGSEDVAQLDGGDTWDGGFMWGPGSYEGHADAWSPGVAKHWQIRLEETSDMTHNSPPMLGIGAAEEMGAWAMYGVYFEPLQAGRS